METLCEEFPAVSYNLHSSPRWGAQCAVNSADEAGGRADGSTLPSSPPPVLLRLLRTQYLMFQLLQPSWVGERQICPGSLLKPFYTNLNILGKITRTSQN